VSIPDIAEGGCLVESEKKEETWSVRSRFKLVVPDGFTRHRGMVYPRLMSFEWTRADGLTVAIDVEMSETEGASVQRFTVEAPEGEVLSPADFRQPISSMAKRGAERQALQPDGLGNAGPAGDPEQVTVQPMRPAKTNSNRLQRVAELALEAEAAGENIVSGIVKHEGVRRGQAYNLISEARKAGFLPPSGPGRKPRAHTDVTQA
jgi:hypothetical protein